jgi:hypothetical protein
MGLLDIASGQSDVNRAQGVAASVCGSWNSHCSSRYGFIVTAHTPDLKVVCERGTELLQNTAYFPTEPGPFKRVATFLVFGRLHPFYSTKNGVGTVFNDQQRQNWNTRFLVLSIGPLLRQTHLLLDGQSRHVMAGWKGFPSLHYLLEFLVWLRWLDDFKRFQDCFKEDWPTVSTQRLARMVISTSLIVEASYYEAKSPFPNSCLNDLRHEQRLDLMYDYEIGWK